MWYIPDRLGMFKKIPFYEPLELDELCERDIRDYMNRSRGGFNIPIPTETLALLIEKRAESLDVYADLTHYGRDVEGVTEFQLNGLPQVLIQAKLGATPYLATRYRSTLAHEYGHVLLHTELYTATNLCKPVSATSRLYSSATSGEHQIKPGAQRWMEWQAWRVCSAILLPRSCVWEQVQIFLQRRGLRNITQLVRGHRIDVIAVIAKIFAVSQKLAEQRLLQLDILTKN